MNAPTIVVGFDGSANAQSALEAAVDMAADDGVVHVVTAYRREMAGVMASSPEEFRRSFDVLDAPRGHLQESEAFLAERGIDHKGHFIADNPASAILDVADDVGANMIIVGSRGLGRGTRLIRRSVSSRIANHAKTSFMVIHPDRDNGKNGDRDDMDLDRVTSPGSFAKRITSSRSRSTITS
jgi:nucleotide-binding universal stress UspA family protein